MSQGELEKRFGHLLQPIRDLTKNWEVDVAAELKEYLQEIETIKISFDGGATTMNFAEAALLIQGSACIYSKKVEYLYSLVYQTLDLLANRRKQQLPSSVDNEGNDKDASLAERNTDQEFLLLDDVQDSNNVDMKTTDHNDNIQLMVQTPMSLQKLDDINKDTPLLSRKGEMLGNRGDFRFNTGSILASGLLLMDVAQLSNMEYALTRAPHSTPIVLDNANMNDEFANVPVEDALPDIPAPDNATEPHDISLDDVDMGDVMENSFQEQEQQSAHRMELRTRELQPVKITSTKFVDPWLVQDPHDADAVLQKAFKKGNPAKLPPSLETNKKRKRKNTQEKNLQPFTDFISKAYNTYSNKLPSSALKRPTFTELEYLYWQEFRRQQQVFRNEKKSLARQGRYWELEEREKEDDEERQAEEEREENLLPIADDNGPDEFGFDNDDDDEEDGPHQLGVDDQVPPIAIEDEEPVISSYEDLVRHHVESYLISAQKFAQLTELSKRVSEWEDKMAPVLQREEMFGYFDIHEYGTKVLSKLAERNDGIEEVSFREVVSESSSFDVGRLFLASLQLANSRNIDIGCETIDGVAVVDTMRLNLLQQERHHEQLAMYRAPSIN